MKEFIIQEEAERGGAKDHPTTAALMAKREYPKFCKNCKETGHTKAGCPHKGKIKCLACKELTTHKAANCPRVRSIEQPKFEQNRVSRGRFAGAIHRKRKFEEYSNVDNADFTVDKSSSSQRGRGS